MSILAKDHSDPGTYLESVGERILGEVLNRLPEVGTPDGTVIDMILHHLLRVHMSLPEESRVVTRFPEIGRDRFEIADHRKLVSRQSDVTILPWIEPRQESRPRRAANRIRHVGPGVTNPGLRKSIESRSMYSLLTVTPEMVAIVL